MAVFPNSRYTQGTYARVPSSTSADSYNLVIFRRVPSSQTNFKLYVWRIGDRLDNVAFAQLNNPTLWWSIIDFNPEIIDPFNIPAGTAVRIPIAPVLGQGTLLQ